MLILANALRDIDSTIAPVGLRERSLHADAIADDFDLAEALLRPDSIAAALRVLARRELALLRLVERGPATRADVEALLGDDAQHCIDVCSSRFLLVTTDSHLSAIPDVSAELDRAGVAPLEHLSGAESPIAVATRTVDTLLIDRLAAERAARTCAELSALILTLAAEPGRQLAKGGLALPDMKRIANAARVEMSEVPALHDLACASSLVFCDTPEWLPTVEAEGWLGASMSHRWSALAAAVWAAQPRELREVGRVLSAEAPRETSALHRFKELLQWMFPAFTHVDVAMERFTASAMLVGLVVGSEFSALGRLVIRGADPSAFHVEAAALLPAEVHKLYVQPDYSIVVPGPAAPAVERMLRAFSDVEQSDLASTFRISAASVNRALATGVQVPAIRAFLAEASLTGIPQPVDFLLTQAEEQFGRVRIRELDEPPIASSVRVLDSHLLDVLAVDQTLNVLGFERRKHELVSRVSVTHVLLVLDAAKYPAALEDSTGTIIPLQPSVARSLRTATAADPIQAMWDRIRDGRRAVTDESAWMNRQIQSAVKLKTTLLVEIRLPSGGVAEYVLEPIGLAGNRMRARDRRSDIERTLPLASIVSIAPAPPGTN